MATYVRPNTFPTNPEEKIYASELNAEYDGIQKFANTQVAHADGSRSYAVHPPFSVDPTTDTQPARRLYVHNQLKLARYASATAAPTFSTGSTTYVDVATLADLVKVRGTETKLLIEFSGTSHCDNAVSAPTWALSIGGTDYYIHYYHHNTVGMHRPMGSFAEVTGMTAGTKAVKIRVKIDGGSNIIKTNTNDRFYVVIREVFA